MKTELFALERASVSTGPTSILKNVSLHIYRGHPLSIVCSSLTEKDIILELFRGGCAIHGTVRFDHTVVRHAAPSRFVDCFYTIDPRQQLIPTMSIAENILLSAPRPLLSGRRRPERQAAQLIDRLKVRLDLTKKIRDLTSKELVQVKLLKAYATKKRIIILRDLSSLLNANEIEEIRRIVEKMNSEDFTFVLIDSPETTICSWAEETLIIKNHTTAGCFPSSLCRTPAFFRYLLSDSSEARPKQNFRHFSFEEMPYDQDFSPVFEFDRVIAEGLLDLSFALYPGELLKIHCLDSKSIEAFRNLATGSTPLYSGSIRIDDKPYVWKNNAGKLSKDGIMWCPEIPYQHILYPNMTLLENLLYTASRKTSRIWRRPAYRESIIQYICDHIGAQYVDCMIRDLPIAIRQAAAYTVCLLLVPKVIFIEQPFYHTDSEIADLTLSMLAQLQERQICIIVLTTSPTYLQRLDGETLYIKEGRQLTESEMYQELYSEQE